MIESNKLKNPFPGLRPFETDEYRLFFGREGQSDALISRLQRSHFLAVVGTSGSGKSSLVRAGLLPSLRGGLMAGAGSGWRIAIMRPGSDPIGNLALALADQEVLLEAGGGLPPAEAYAVIEATLRRGSLGLVDVARKARLAEHEKLLLVVDQFEELFRFRGARTASSTGDDASAFVKLLLEAAQQNEFSIYVVPTMRSDFLGDCAQFQGLPEAINDGQYLIPRMTRDERRFAITGPVGVTRGKIAEPLVSRLMNDVGDNPDQLPILQHALMRTWDYWATHRRNGEPIGLEHYEAVGTMSDALSEHADEAFNELPDERSRVIAEVLFKALTERGADNREIRRPTSVKDICEIANASVKEVSAIVEVFRGGGRSFLMPPAGVALQPETVIDISHESLIRNWRRLKEWVKDEAESARIYKRLAGAATDCRAGVGGLLDDVTLQFVLRWREKSKPDRAWGARYSPEFDDAMAYLEESRAARDARIAAERERERRELETAHAFAEKQARSAHRMRRLTAALFLILLFALGTAAYALHARSDAKQSENNERVAKVLAERSAQQERVAKESAVQSAKDARVALLTAEQSAKEARAAQEKAVDSAERLKEQTQKTEKSLANERRALATVSQNLKKLEDAKIRSEYSLRAVAAFQREDYKEALNLFESALYTLDEELKRQGNDLKMRIFLKYSQITLMSYLGATQGKLGRDDETYFEKAINSYEEAEKLTSELGLQAANNDAFRWTSIDVYYGLAHAYRDLAIQLQLTAFASIPPKVRDLNSKAERYFKLVLDTQRKMEQKVSDERLASSSEYLARLYRDLGDYERAEPVYKSIVELHEKSTYPDRYVATLKELAEFYSILGHLRDAEKAYNKAIDLQEEYTLDRGYETVDSYNKLGQVYLALHQEEKANTAFLVANLLQQATLKYKRGEKEALCPYMVQMAVVYAKLDRPKQVRQSYDIALASGSCLLEKAHEAEDLLTPALAISTAAALPANWREEDAIYATLITINTRLQNRDSELDVLYDRRLKNLIKRSGEFVGPHANTLNEPLLLFDYLNAAAEIAKFYAQHRKNSEAEVAYRMAFNALDFVKKSSKPWWFCGYEKTLIAYRGLLFDLKKPEEAAKVGEAIISIHEIQKVCPEAEEQESPSH